MGNLAQRFGSFLRCQCGTIWRVELSQGVVREWDVPTSQIGRAPLAQKALCHEPGRAGCAVDRERPVTPHPPPSTQKLHFVGVEWSRGNECLEPGRKKNPAFAGRG